MFRAFFLLFLLSSSALAENSCRLALARFATTDALRAEIRRHENPQARIYTHGDDVALLYRREDFDRARNESYACGVDDQVVRRIAAENQWLLDSGVGSAVMSYPGLVVTALYHMRPTSPAIGSALLKWVLTGFFTGFLVVPIVQFVRYFRRPLMKTIAHEIDLRVVLSRAGTYDRHAVALAAVPGNRIPDLGEELEALGWRRGFQAAERR